jgi:hypothetical protein
LRLSRSSIAITNGLNRTSGSRRKSPKRIKASRELSASKFYCRVGDGQPGDAAAHTVADDNHPLAQWKLSLSGTELLAEDYRGVRIWVTARVAVKPELVMTPDALVTTQVVDQIASQFPLRISYKLL